MNPILILVAFAVGYLIGSIPFGYLIAKSRGVDILSVGSGNPGATNVKRSVGKGAGNICFTLDALKGVVSAGWPLWIPAVAPETASAAPGIIGLLGAIAGHSFSIFLKFRGGKGVATAMGGLLVIMPIVVLIKAGGFGVSEARWSLYPMGGSAVRLPRQIPYAKMMEMLLVGRPFSAQEALDMGLLNYVVPPSQLMDKALELAGLLAANGPLAVSKIKEGVIRSSGLPLAESYQIENEVSVAVMTSKDAREGPRAFKEKRKPNFTGE